MKVVILSRVSTHTQDNQRQNNELTEFSSTVE
jgi:DNA invertase Pin-like site-specific DNA recombinase